MVNMNEVIPKLSVSQRPEEIHSLKKDLYNPDLHFLSRLEVREGKNNGSKYSRGGFKPLLNIRKIISVFKKSENEIAKITIPLAHFVSRKNHVKYEFDEIYGFEHETFEKEITVFGATHRGEPIHRRDSMGYSVLVLNETPIHKPCTIDMRPKNYLVLGFINKGRRSEQDKIWTLVYVVEEIMPFPSDHPTISPHVAKNVYLANCRVVHIESNLVSLEGGVLESYTHSAFQEHEQIFTALAARTHERLTSPKDVTPVYRELVFEHSCVDKEPIQEEIVGSENFCSVEPENYAIEVMRTIQCLWEENRKQEKKSYSLVLRIFHRHHGEDATLHGVVMYWDRDPTPIDALYTIEEKTKPGRHYNPQGNDLLPLFCDLIPGEPPREYTVGFRG